MENCVFYANRVVQFLPVREGASTGPGRVLGATIDEKRNHGTLFNHGNGEIQMG